MTGELLDAAVREEAVTSETAAIVHLAALTSVLRSVELPEQTFADNVLVTQELLELARRLEVPGFVLASTNAVIGNVGGATITPDLPPRPLTPYGATKAACEMLLSGYAGAYGMKTCALRFTNVYGPGMSHKDSFVPRMMRAALTGTGVRVYGDGQQRRDLVHVDDVVNAITLAVGSGYSGTAIVGAGKSVSVLEMVEAVREVTGAELPVEHVEAPHGGDARGGRRRLGERGDDRLPAVDVADRRARHGVEVLLRSRASERDGVTAGVSGFLRRHWLLLLLLLPAIALRVLTWLAYR